MNSTITNHNIKKIVSIALASTIAVSGFAVAFKLKKNNNQYDDKIITSISSTYDADEQETTLMEEVSNVEKTTLMENKSIIEESKMVNIETPTITYDVFAAKDEIREELNEVIRKKHFNKDIDNVIIETFNLLYDNCDSYCKSNNMDKEEFIRENYINAIRDNIDVIKVDETMGYGGSYNQEEKKITIKTTNTYNNNLENFAHEVDHSLQMNLNDNLSFNMKYIFTEGRSTCTKLMYTNGYDVNLALKCYNNNNDCYAIKGVSSSDEKYVVASKCYGMITTLVDNETLKEFYEGEELNVLESYISDNYNVNGKELFSLMDNTISNMSYDNVEKLEQIMNKCFYNKVNSLSSSKEVIEFMNLKRKYDMQFCAEKLTNVEDEYSFKIEKESKLDPYNINDILYEKVMEYETMPILNENKEDSRKIFGSIMGEDTDSYSFYSVGENQNIVDQSVSYSSGKLIIYDEDKPVVCHNYNTGEIIRESERIIDGLSEKKPMFNCVVKVI